MGTLDGRVAIVTGGASGIGLATATRFAKEGARVVIADLNDAAGKEAADNLDGRFIRADVGDPADWEDLVAEAEQAFGGLDIAYLNAGVTTNGLDRLGAPPEPQPQQQARQAPDITTLTDAKYRRIMGANVDGVVFGTRAVVPALVRRGGGSIVATASMAGIIAFSPDPIYTATKHAVVGFVRSMAAQLEPRSITINAVCPGIVDTPLVGLARERLKTSGFAMIPPEDIAEAVLGAITGGDTGQCIVCQAGRPPTPFEFRSPTN